MQKICLLLAILVVGCHPKDDSALTHRLQALLDAKEYFKLENQYKAAKNDLTPGNRRYFAAFLYNAFNQNEACVAAVDTALGEPFPDSVRAKLLLLQGDSYFKLGQYARAAHTDSAVIGAGAVDTSQLKDVKNELLIRNALKGTPAQQRVVGDSTTVRWAKDAIGLIEVPVIAGGQAVDAIFDTRANISSITKTYAGKLHLRLFDVSYTEGSGITGIEFKVGLGVADSLYIGKLLVRNVVFQVMPDSILYIAPIKFQLNVILGFPLIAGLDEVKFYKDGRLIIPEREAGDGQGFGVDSGGHNLAMDGLDPVLALITEKDTLSYHFDTGAGTSILYAGYFHKYEGMIRQSAIKKSQSFGGAGGVEKKDVYILPSIRLTLGKKTVAVDSVSVLTDKIFPGEKLYGNIGRDFMNQFDELIFNFRDMYVRGR
ncbi:aspartyl protease family protein [Puia sp. P3]|uniref:aspartyl protease family protein n=1 Tax=Puia sp. P3 TaxID=3423952 RepID=UPI003D67C5FB